MSKRSKSLPIVIAAGAVAMLSAKSFGVVYTWAAGAGSFNWAVNANWNPSTGNPGSAAGDDANLNVNLGGAALTVDINAAMANPITNLIIGGSGSGDSTTISGSGGSLGFTNATVTGTAGNSNVISAQVTLPATPMAIVTNTGTSLNITGGINNNSGAARTINHNSSNVGSLTIGGVTVSTVNNATTIFTNDNVAGTTSIGAITGSGLGTTIAYARGIFNLTGSNTYTGNTTLGQNSPGAAGVFKISTNSPFGTGTVSFGGAAASTSTIEAVGGARTIGNNFTLQRNHGSQGTNSITHNGNWTQSGSTTETNNLSGGAVLTLNGSIFTNNNSQQGRIITFNGTGPTVITGVITDSSVALGVPADGQGTLANTGTGSITLTNANTYGGDTRISVGGRVQLGNGSTTGSLKSGTVITGGSTSGGQTGGTLALNRSDNFTLNNPLNGLIGLSQEGANTVTISSPMFQSGNNTIGTGTSASTLLANQGLFSGTTLTGTAAAPALQNGGVINNFRVISGLSSTANLRVGQPVYKNGTAANAGAYIRSIDSSTQITIWGFGGTGTALDTVTVPNGAATLDFGSGSSLGKGGTTTVNNLATLGGTGAIDGSVVSLTGGTVAPGASIGTLSITGATTLNSGATLAIEWNNAGAGSADILASGGPLNITGATVSFTALGGPQDDSAYVFASYPAGQLTGTFASILNAPAGMTIDYNYQGLNQIALVPEPSVIGGMALGAIAAFGRRRRKA